MSESKAMYKEHILEHYKKPSNFGTLEDANAKFEMDNPLCGDNIEIQLIIDHDKVKDVKFKGKGCALSIASASLLTEKVKGMSVDEVMKMKKEDILELMKIPIGPVRLKCALLPLEAMHKAIR